MLTEDLFDETPMKEINHKNVDIDENYRSMFYCECNGCRFRDKTSKLLVPIFFFGIFFPPILLLNNFLAGLGLIKSLEALKRHENFSDFVKQIYFINLNGGVCFDSDMESLSDNRAQAELVDTDYYHQLSSECSSITKESHWESIKKFNRWSTLSFTFFLIECLIVVLTVLLAFASDSISNTL